MGTLIGVRPMRYRLGAAPQQGVEAAHRLSLHRRQGVAVAVEGDRDVLVAERLGHDLGIGAGRKLQGGEGVGAAS